VEKGFLPHVFRRARVPAGAADGGYNKDNRLFKFRTMKSRKAQTFEERIYTNASVDSSFVRDLEDALSWSETTISLHSIDGDCNSRAKSILDEMSIFFDPKSEFALPSDEINADGDDEFQSAGCCLCGEI
jgi:hypothetical protein